MQDAVGVDVEGDLDLRHTARGRWYAFQVELSEALVAGGNIALALQHMDRHRRLIVVGGGKHLLCLGRNGGVLLNQLGHHPAEGFYPER